MYLQTEEIRPSRDRNGTPGNGAVSPTLSDRTTELVFRIQALSEERDDINRQAEDFARRLRAHHDLLAVVSHDLRNALTVVKASSQIALRHSAPPSLSTERVVADLTRLDRSVAAMARQIDQFGDVAEILGGRTPCLQRHPCDLVDLARQVTADYQAMTDRHDIRVESTEPQLVGTWDALRLARVLANLISNAIKYSPDAREIAVTLAADPAQSGVAVVTVRDHGIGIPPSDLPLLFTPFHRGGNVGSVSGTGMGLASVKLVVELHGGTIAAASREGIGTTVTICLPLMSPSAIAMQPKITAN